MSLRTSRRGQASVQAEVPSVPISEIRTRKWTKQLRTVGHLTLYKWVPDQPSPTKALQKGTFKKTKGRKRSVVEVGRMTRSVRQHLDAPLELLNEYPALRQSSQKQVVAAPAPVVDSVTSTTVSGTVSAENPVPVQTIETVQQLSVSQSVQSTNAVTTPVNSAGLSSYSSSSIAVTMMQSTIPTNQPFPSGVPSDEQLEMALDDLPMLDEDEELPLGDLTQGYVAPTPITEVTPPVEQNKPVETTVNSSNDNDTADDDDDDNSNSSSSDDEASANSPSPLPSPSPLTSPMMSRSPSP